MKKGIRKGALCGAPVSVHYSQISLTLLFLRPGHWLRYPLMLWHPLMLWYLLMLWYPLRFLAAAHGILMTGLPVLAAAGTVLSGSGCGYTESAGI